MLNEIKEKSHNRQKIDKSIKWWKIANCKSSVKVIIINHKHQTHVLNVKRKAEHLKERENRCSINSKKYSSLFQKIEYLQLYAILLITKRSLLIVELFKIHPRSV